MSDGREGFEIKIGPLLFVYSEDCPMIDRWLLMMWVEVRQGLRGNYRSAVYERIQGKFWNWRWFGEVGEFRGCWDGGVGVRWGWGWVGSYTSL